MFSLSSISEVFELYQRTSCQYLAYISFLFIYVFYKLLVQQENELNLMRFPTCPGQAATFLDLLVISHIFLFPGHISLFLAILSSVPSEQHLPQRYRSQVYRLSLVLKANPQTLGPSLGNTEYFFCPLKWKKVILNFWWEMRSFIIFIQYNKYLTPASKCKVQWIKLSF